MEEIFLLAEFPRLAPPAQFQITSVATPSYNCIAWAAGDLTRVWWPDRQRVAFWPKEVSRTETLQSFVAAYRTLGYEPCESGELEIGFEKIAIFLRGGLPKHAARQLPDDRWTSKLGRDQDIAHDLHGLEGNNYGRVKQFMRRQIEKAHPPASYQEVAPAPRSPIAEAGSFPKGEVTEMGSVPKASTPKYPMFSLFSQVSNNVFLLFNLSTIPYQAHYLDRKGVALVIPMGRDRRFCPLLFLESRQSSTAAEPCGILVLGNVEKWPLNDV
jgi:hypothetical protein